MPKPSPEDVLLVRNIDVNCTDVTTETVKVKKKIFDEMKGQFRTIEEDQTISWNHAEGFQVRYGGYTQKIAPGATRNMPRYIAEHYAKHLVDHMMEKRGFGTLLNDKNARNKVMAEIILKVESYFLPEEEVDEVITIGNRIDALNPEHFEPKEQVEVPVTSAPEQEVNIPVDIEPTPKPEPTIGELRSECKTLGIEIKNTDTKEILTNKIKQFAGI